MTRARIPTLVLIADVLAVLVFVAVGRLSHAETGVLDLAAAWAPFALAAVVAWTTPWARADPLGLRAGLLTVGITAFLGLALRSWVVGELPQWPFPLVTLVSLAVLMLGWRGVAVLTRARVERSSARS